MRKKFTLKKIAKKMTLKKKLQKIVTLGKNYTNILKKNCKKNAKNCEKLRKIAKIVKNCEGQFPPLHCIPPHFEINCTQPPFTPIPPCIPLAEFHSNPF